MLVLPIQPQKQTKQKKSSQKYEPYCDQSILYFAVHLSNQFEQKGNNSSIVITTNCNHCMSDGQGQSKPINISVDNIEINQSKLQRDPKSVFLENKMIRRQNVLLKKQLEGLSCRLDSQISKRLESKKKESGSEDVAQLQLQNSYKKCEMYKREAMVYRKKFEALTDDPRFEDFQRKIIQYQKENKQLKSEIKHTNKILKSQSKGLAELGFEEFPSVVAERDQLKEQVRILKKEMAQYRRSVDVKKKFKKNSKSNRDRNVQWSQEKNDTVQDEEGIGEDNVRNKAKNEQQQDRQTEVESVHKKAEKYYQQMKSLQTERNKLRELVDNLKNQLAEKQKENTYLRDKINELRTNNQLLKSHIVTKPKQRSKQNKIKKLNIKHRYVESEQSQHATTQLKSRNGQKINKKSTYKQVRTEPEITEDINNTSNYLPGKEDSRTPNSSLIKWNHQHLSSKIKELQILEHQNGHIKDLHVRYLKGEPKKYSTNGGKNNYKIFACSQDEYIRHVQGLFDQGYLQYLVIISNYSRVQKYGKFQQYEQSFQGEHFRFEVGDNAFPGALFGQKDSFGIIKLGCFIHKDS